MRTSPCCRSRMRGSRCDPRSGPGRSRPRPEAGLHAVRVMLDRRGNPVGTASAAALDHAERALWRLMTFYGTPLEDLDAAAAADPGWVLPGLMKAGFLIGLSEAGFARQGEEVLATLAPRLKGATERERAHHAALLTLAAGDWHAACRAWEALLLDH